ncbi:hypothetical protein DRO56_04910 [Candidatus Bathyarchaeota archaeon]|nr:MAG: hypothetical protein DRO56_04910 [Candidatus Bathyarchaeota archaeon]
MTLGLSYSIWNLRISSASLSSVRLFPSGLDGAFGLAGLPSAFGFSDFGALALFFWEGFSLRLGLGLSGFSPFS